LGPLGVMHAARRPRCWTVLNQRQNKLERRQYPRLPFHAEAVVSEGGRALGAVRFENLSLSGALLLGDIEPDVGSVVQVTVTSGRLIGASFGAEVRWIATASGAVRFGIQIPP
jgi:hypothetical protein